MKIRDRFRIWLQNFIGILALEKAAQRRSEEHVIEIRQGISMLTDRINLLENGMVAGDRHSEISERLGRIENMFMSQHIPDRHNQIVEYDWDQVQSMVLADMMKNPPKEEN